MADALLIAELRRLTDELTQDPYTDAIISDRLDAVDGNVRLLAGTIWQEKAARFAGLIDVQEGNSNRKMSQLYSQALKMADSFGANVDVTVATFRPARTRKIERG